LKQDASFQKGARVEWSKATKGVWRNALGVGPGKKIFDMLALYCRFCASWWYLYVAVSKRTETTRSLGARNYRNKVR